MRHVVGEDLFGESVDLESVITALRKLSVWDCLHVIAYLHITLVEGGDVASMETQQRLVGILVEGDERLGPRLASLLGSRERDVAVFEQQLYHLARLSILHAEDRPPDQFGDGALIPEFMVALFGCADQFFADLGRGDLKQNMLTFELQSAAINHTEERLTLWAFYFELFNEIWPRVEKAPDVDDAFSRYTGLSISEYLALGFAVETGFSHETPSGPAADFDPTEWLGDHVEPSKAAAYFEMTGGTLAELREGLEAEEEDELGGSVVASLAIERRPVVKAPSGRVYLVNFRALERRATHGIFHILSEGADHEGKDRETYTSHFGAAFQIWVEDSFRRMEDGKDEPTIFCDEPYGTRKFPKDTSDVVLVFERNVIALDAVAGAMRARTWSLGDLDAFEADLEKLVYKKAKQLSNRIDDIRSGETEKIGLSQEGVVRYWPVIVMAAPFPGRPTVMKTVRDRIKARGWLTQRDVAPIAIVTAEDLAALESFLESNDGTVLDVIRGWKSHADTGDFPVQNYLSENGSLMRAAEHFREAFTRGSTDIVKRLFGPDAQAPPLPEDVDP